MLTALQQRIASMFPNVWVYHGEQSGLVHSKNNSVVQLCRCSIYTLLTGLAALSLLRDLALPNSKASKPFVKKPDNSFSAAQNATKTTN